MNLGGAWGGTYGYPTESATLADTIYINTEPGPLGSVAKVEIISGVNDPTGAWPKVEMAVNTNWASAQGAWYHYELPAAELEVGTLDYAICVTSTNGTEFWDNNGGGNYTMQILPAPEEANFAFQSVSANPVNPDPESRVTVTVILRTDLGTPIDSLGCQIGYDLYDPATGPADVWPTHAMTRASVITNDTTAVLSTFTYTVDSGLTNGYVMKYYIAASNGASTVLYANNGGLDYTVQVKDWPAVPADIVISTSNQTTQSASATVAGTAGANLVGRRFWTNGLTGDSGAFDLTGRWNIEIPLNVGANLITVYGYEAGNIETTAMDSAVNYSTWSNGFNEGTGFGAWSFVEVANFSGHFLATNNDTCQLTKPAFGMWAHTENTAEVFRPFSPALAVGDTFSIAIDNGSIDNGHSSGIGLQTAEGDNLWEFYFVGGEFTYKMNGGATDIGWTADGLTIEFTLTSATTYRAVITPLGGSARTYSGSFSGAIARFHAWHYSATGGEDHNFYFNDLKITSQTPGDLKQDFVTITREDDGNPRIEYTGSRSLTLGDAGAAFDLEFSLTNATAASWSAALTTVGGSHVQSWSGVAGATWDWTWTAYAAGSWRLRVTAHDAGAIPSPMPRSC
jgi:hypothetical protein